MCPRHFCELGLFPFHPLQSFNALVNYTNRNAESPVTTAQLGLAYASATFSALATAIGLRKMLERSAPPFVQRFVPFVAVGAANCVNIPLMRNAELNTGVDLRDENGNKMCRFDFFICFMRPIFRTLGKVFSPPNQSIMSAIFRTTCS